MRRFAGARRAPPSTGPLDAAVQQDGSPHFRHGFLRHECCRNDGSCPASAPRKSEGWDRKRGAAWREKRRKNKRSRIGYLRGHSSGAAAPENKPAAMSGAGQAWRGPRPAAAALRRSGPEGSRVSRGGRAHGRAHGLGRSQASNRGRARCSAFSSSISAKSQQRWPAVHFRAAEAHQEALCAAPFGEQRCPAGAAAAAPCAAPPRPLPWHLRGRP